MRKIEKEMINLMVDLEGLDIESVKAVRRLAYHAESRIDGLIGIGEEQGWPAETMDRLRDQLEQSILLWDKCVDIVGGEHHVF